MNYPAVIDLELTVAQLLAQYPECIPLFLRRRMLCVGCPMAPFDTLADAARNYQLETAAFITEVRSVVESTHEEK